MHRGHQTRSGRIVSDRADGGSRWRRKFPSAAIGGPEQCAGSRGGGAAERAAGSARFIHGWDDHGRAWRWDGEAEIYEGAAWSWCACPDARHQADDRPREFDEPGENAAALVMEFRLKITHEERCVSVRLT